MDNMLKTKRQTCVEFEVAPVKSEHTCSLPTISELSFLFADVAEVTVGVNLAPTGNTLSGNIDTAGYEDSFKVAGVNLAKTHAKQFASAVLTDVKYTGPRFQLVRMKIWDSLTGSAYNIPAHKLRAVNRKLIAR